MPCPAAFAVATYCRCTSASLHCLHPAHGVMAGCLMASVDHLQVSLLYTAPTAIRSLMAKGTDIVKKASRKSLRILGTVGEPINVEAWKWYNEVLLLRLLAIMRLQPRYPAASPLGQDHRTLYHVHSCQKHAGLSEVVHVTEPRAHASLPCPRPTTVACLKCGLDWLSWTAVRFLGGT